ncbi:MAG TPA: hypothetical protein VGK19_20005 [Capsulimonadaceae bacterium]|jgi:hypothetical protein
MKTIGKILGIRPTTDSPDIVSRLAKIYEPGYVGDHFECILPINDPAYMEVQAQLQRDGFEPWLGYQKRRENEYWFELILEYTPSDLAEFEFFVPRPQKALGSDLVPLGRRPLGIEYNRSKSQKDIGFVGFPHVVVSASFKNHLESRGLTRILFRETVYETRQKVPNPAPYFQLASDLVLPPMAKSVKLVNNDGQPFGGDYENGCHIFQPFVREREPHYSKESFNGLPDFDVAFTAERFGNFEETCCQLTIVSSRFRDICMERKLPMNWLPVHIDAE